MFDNRGNLWVGDNFTVGWQGQDKLWQGNATEFDPNGHQLCPITVGFSGAEWKAERWVHRSTPSRTFG
jgi:hypothetical protein